MVQKLLEMPYYDNDDSDGLWIDFENPRRHYNDPDGILWEIIDPISANIYFHPVIASDTYTYERDVLLLIFKTYDGISPYTGEKLDFNNTDNKHERIIEMVNKFLKKHPSYYKYDNYYCFVGINSNISVNYALLKASTEIPKRFSMEDTRDDLLFSIMEKMNNHE